MPTYTITSDDTFTIYDRNIVDLATDDVSSITFPNDLVTMQTGKNKNTIYSKDEKGNNADVVLRVMRGSSDDQFLQGKIAEMNKDFVSAQLASGQFVKRLGDGEGNVRRDVYTLLGGVITKQVEGKENTSGDTEQAVAIYNFKFAQAARSIQ